MERGMILVTGGAGYIGSHAVLSLLELGEKVAVLDDLSTGSRERVPEGAEFILGDIADRELLKRVFASHTIECVMHFAGVVKVEESVRDPQKYFRINVDATQVLAEEVRAAGVPYFIFSTTTSLIILDDCSKIAILFSFSSTRFSHFSWLNSAPMKKIPTISIITDIRLAAFPYLDIKGI
jgi:UDP-glucose 4-epimerase